MCTVDFVSKVDSLIQTRNQTEPHVSMLFASGEAAWFCISFASLNTAQDHSNIFSAIHDLIQHCMSSTVTFTSTALCYSTTFSSTVAHLNLQKPVETLCNIFIEVIFHFREDLKLSITLKMRCCSLDKYLKSYCYSDFNSQCDSKDCEMQGWDRGFNQCKGYKRRCNRSHYSCQELRWSLLCISWD